MSVKDTLSVLMRAHGIKQAELARRAKVPQSTLSRICSGRIRDPKDAPIAALAAFFGESVEAIRGRAPLVTVRDGAVTDTAPSTGLAEYSHAGIIDGARRLLLRATEGMSDDQLLLLIEAANAIRRGGATAIAIGDVRADRDPPDSAADLLPVKPQAGT